MRIRLFAMAALAFSLAGCGGAPLTPAPQGFVASNSRLAGLRPDAATHTLVVADSTSNMITVYQSTATGDMQPIRKIHGAATGLDEPNYVALNAAGDIFVTNLAANSVTEYAPTASGDAAPLATLSGGVTQLSMPTGIALDSTGRVYVANFSSGGSYIMVYRANPNGGVAPSQTIYDSVGLYSIAGLAVHGTTIYASVLDIFFDAEINEYLTSDNGTVNTTAQIGGLTNPMGVSVEGDGKIVVADGSALKVFAADANGSPSPLQTITGSTTHLSGPAGVAIGSDDIFVADTSTPAVTSYKIAWTGNKAPLTDLTGSLTKLAAPVGIAFRQ